MTIPHQGPLVSIIIPAYNSGEHISQCINSVLAQTYRNWEAIIVLAPSMDNTFDVLMGYHDGRIVIFGEGRKTNCATARNTGIDLCQGKYVAMLDADDFWEPKKLEVMVYYLEHHPLLEWAAHGIYFYHSGITKLNIEYPGQTPYIWGCGGIVFRKPLLDRTKKRDGFIFDPSLNHNDDADLVLRVRNELSAMIPIGLSTYRTWVNGSLTYSAGELGNAVMMLKLVWKNRVYEYLPWHIKNVGYSFARRIFFGVK